MHLKSLQQKEPKASYPGQDRDRLFQSAYLHSHRSLEERCDTCIERIGVCAKDCNAIGCEETQLVERARLKNLEAGSSPRLHFGRYGSANNVLRSGVDRDRHATTDKILAFEMEAAGIWESLPTIIVKSACDYADSHKSKEWQGYAAATAAAGLKAILEKWEISDTALKQVDDYNIPFNLDGVPVAKKFIDRPREMLQLENVLLPNKGITRRRLFVLRGLDGIGKTQLAVNFMRSHQDAFSTVLWLNGASKDSLKQSIVQYASRITSISDTSRNYVTTGQGDIDNVVDEVINWLKLPGNNQWLMVFDNVDREFLASDPDPSSYDIRSYIPGVDHGPILITTRLTQLERLGESQEVKIVDDETAKAILSSWYDFSYSKKSYKFLSSFWKTYS